MMATSQDAGRSLSREKGPATMHSMRSRTDSERLPSMNGSADENRSPPAIPRAFESMLKTTTETGDIGVFSIKPSRLPQSFNTFRRIGGSYRDSELQKPLQSPPHGVSMRDDRKRLPSYRTDASSEVLYETASQKSISRLFDDPDHRSFSMNQTYSSYTLSNHRSYASLRSQPDSSALQRPRSPFAYPTRLKRPGFRPSSPALTDGGGVDYTRRAEIERPPYAPDHSTSSSSTLFTQRRKPTTLSLRPDANRSTTSLFSQPSPPRQSPSPRVGQRTGAIHNDWQRKNGPPSLNTSPARSTLSLASSVNLYQAVQISSTTTTPGRIHPPSPLYYDYTEDFDVGDYDQPEMLEPPPQFQVEKTIPEDRPLSADLHPCENSDGQGIKLSPGSTISTISTTSCSTSILQGSPKIPQKPNRVQNNTNIIGTERGTNINTPAALRNKAGDKICDLAAHKDDLRLSRLSHGARELSTHVEEAFGLLSPPVFEILSTSNSMGPEAVRCGVVPKCSGSTSGRDNGDIGEQSFEASSYILNSHPRQFPPAPQVVNISFAHSHNYTETKQIPAGSGLENIVGNSGLRSPESLQEQASTLKGSIEVYRSGQDTSCTTGSEHLSLSSANNERMSQRFSYSADTGRKEPGELMLTIEEPTKSRTSDDKSLACGASRHNLSATSPGFADQSLIWSEFLENSIFNQTHLAFHLEGKDGRKPVLDQGSRRNHLRGRGRKAGVPELSAEEVPSSSCQIPQNLISRSNSPMLAPKPISPARQLRLKNSVPQLMKALPPLPPNRSTRAVSPPTHSVGSDVEVSCRFSTLISDPSSTPTPGLPRAEELYQSLETMGSEPSSVVPAPIELDSIPTQFVVAKEKETNVSETAFPPKMKLKLRNSTSLRPISPDDSRPWNIESYPWSDENVNVGLPKTSQHEIYSNSKPPKFKLKITRASNSTLGTVRVNRESADSKPFVAMQARNPKDLFTPNSGIDNIFRQVGKRLHSHRANLSSNQFPNERNPFPGLPPRFDQIPVARLTNSEAIISQSSAACENQVGPSEVQSFFADDISPIHDRHNLRTRLSNLRARMAAPYASMAASYSHDDINWRDRNGAQAPTPSAARSVDTLHASNTSTEGKRLRRLTGNNYSQKLREKVAGWLKEAKSAMRARMRSRVVLGECDAGDGPVQLTTN